MKKMHRNLFFIVIITVFILAVGGISYHTFFKQNVTDSEQNHAEQKSETSVDEIKSNSDIVPIPIEAVEGITKQEAELLCYAVLGERDEETGFPFSFGTSAAVEKDKKQYYVVRVSWLVDNSHLSYIGDFFVSADGKEIYDGLALPDEYKMGNIIWSE